jgi:ABC-2 type transport system ATP-binding protein
MRYGPVVALDDVSFEVKQGEIVGLLGPNGAGKSTTMKILTTYLHPTNGTAQVADLDVLEHPLEVRRRIGYLPEVPPLCLDMEVAGYLKFVGNARGLTGPRLKERIDVVCDECGLAPMYRRIIGNLSKGYRQRTALAQALIHDPDIIVLDEPTSGLDPHQILEVRDLIRNLSEGKTVIVSTHILQEIEAIADRIVIINRGKIVADGALDELRKQAKRYERTRVVLQADEKEAERHLSQISGVTKVEGLGKEGKFAAFRVYSQADPWDKIYDMSREQVWKIRELSSEPLTLEETFLRLTESREEEPVQGGAAQ